MWIGKLLEILELVDENSVIKNITLNDHGSDRGDYNDFYIGEFENGKHTVKNLKDLLKYNVIGKTFIGYKGGDFTMDEDTRITLGGYGYSGQDIEGILINENGVSLKVQKILYY